MNKYEIYSKRLVWSGAFLLTALMAGCGGGGDGGGTPGGGPKPLPAAGPAHYDFGAAASFGAGSGGGVHNTGLSSAVTGNLGTSAAATTITGLHDAATGSYTETAANAGPVSGTIFTDTTPAGDNHATADAVVAALTKASVDLSPATATGGTEPNAATPGVLGGLTLAPGVYNSAAAFDITAGDLTLDAQGNPDAFWILQAPALTVGDSTTPRNVILANGADAKNVYWWIAGPAVVNAAGGGTMNGTVFVQGSSLDIGGGTATTTLNGRAFIFGGAAINMMNTVITTPAP